MGLDLYTVNVMAASLVTTDAPLHPHLVLGVVVEVCSSWQLRPCGSHGQTLAPNWCGDRHVAKLTDALNLYPWSCSQKYSIQGSMLKFSTSDFK